MNRFQRHALALALPALFASSHAFAQAESAANYPSKPVKIIVGMPPGGATDVLARILGDKLSRTLGQPFVVDNRPGAASIIGTDAVAKAAPDGYTISVALSNATVANQFVYPKLPYNPNKDITFIYHLVNAAVVLVADAKAPFKTAKEFADYAQANPGKVTYASYSAGSYGHTTIAYMDHRLNSQMTHVAYKGEAPMIQGMLSGDAQVAFGSVTNMDPHVKTGKFRYLGVSGPKRMAALPDVPTIAEQGVPDEPFALFGWIKLIGPAGIPQPITEKLAAAVQEALKDPEVNKRILAIVFEPVTDSSPAKTRARYESELPLWKKMIDIAGARVE